MSETDKTPAHVCQVKVGDSPCAVQERARLRAKVQAVYDHVGRQGAPGSDPFDAGRLIALRQVLDIIDREAPPHD
jgi:hypothetical protein